MKEINSEKYTHSCKQNTEWQIYDQRADLSNFTFVQENKPVISSLINKS